MTETIRKMILTSLVIKLPFKVNFANQEWRTGYDCSGNNYVIWMQDAIQPNTTESVLFSTDHSKLITNQADYFMSQSSYG